MSKLNRVVVTGMGVISPLGNTLSEFWDGIKAGRLGIGLITRFDTSAYKVKVAAEVKDFQPEKYMEKKETRRLDLYTQYGLAAASDALLDSGLDLEALKGSIRAGVYFGSGIGGLITMQDSVQKLVEKGPDRVPPLFIPMTIVNMAAGQISQKFGLAGESLPVVSACATGVNAIGEAVRAIRHGYLDIVVAGGSEAAITEISVSGFANLTALTEAKDPARASLPFDRDRAGFVMGEGSGAFVLESLDSALARGARIYAEVAGYGSASDAYHMTAPRPDGSGAAAAMRMTLEDAGVRPDQIGYINAHGTGTQANDLPETLAVKTVFGDYAYKVPFSSTKSMTGHLLGAAGAIEATVCVMALREGFVPATIGLENPGEGCDLDYVPKVGRKHEMEYALTTSLGFGGHNACLCIKKWEGNNAL